VTVASQQVVRAALDRIAARSSVAVTGEVIAGSPESVLAGESRRVYCD